MSADAFYRRLCRQTASRYRAAGRAHRDFVHGKLRFDPMYRAILHSNVVPHRGRFLDLGCGRGILLALLDTARRLDPSSWPAGWRPPADELQLDGIELHAGPAAAARRALADAAHIEVGDAARNELPPSSGIALLDVLHYLRADHQERLLARVAAALEPGGVLILREADAALGVRFLLTRLAERACALGRGHWRQHFLYRDTGAWIDLLEHHGLRVSASPMWAGTPYANQLIEARRC